MQQGNETMCPVCTLYLRPGITLKSHLASHPKQKVIDALVQLSLFENVPKAQFSQQGQGDENIPEAITHTQPPVAQMAPYTNQVAVHPTGMGPGNHFFMYQQSMSTTSPHQSNVSPMPFNPFTQQYLVPAVYNPQMMPYFYQQQQLIMSSNGMPPNVRALPFEIPCAGQVSNSTSRVAEVCTVKEKENEREEVSEKPVDKDNDEDLLRNEEDELIEDSCQSESAEQDKKIEIDIKIQELDENDLLSSDSEGIPDSMYKSKMEDEQERAESPYLPSDSSSDNDSTIHEHDSQDCHYQNDSVDNHNEECVSTSPLSHRSSADWTFPQDLNKACQTQNGANLSPRSQNECHQSALSENRSEYFFIDQRSNISSVYNSEEHQGYEQSEPIYTSANIINNTESMDFLNIDEGMRVIIGDFSNSSFIPPAENYESVRHENPPILMTIGGLPMVPSRPEDNGIEVLEQNVVNMDTSVDDVNIRSDEKMPPRGELSGQESMGSSVDVTWSHMQHYQGQSSAVGYENNSWDSNNEEVPTYTEMSDRKDTITTVDVTVLKQETKDGASSTLTSKGKLPLRPLSLDVNKKKVKKLIIKPKSTKKETQTKFDSVFTAGLKRESSEDVDDPGLENIDGIKEETKPPTINSCKTCDLLFKTKKELLLHNREFHRRLKSKVVKCLICDEMFHLEHKYNEHLKIHPLECRMCGKLFYRRQGLKLHTARHLGIKPFKCDLCDKAFLVKQKLEEHRNCHTGNSPIKCSMCPESFKRHSNLVQHRNKHHFMVKPKTKDFICFCGEVFHSKKKLAWHKEIHDDKPKSCTQCSEKFIHMASLTRHMRRAHNAEYLPDDRDPTMSNTECPVCKGIYLKSSLDAHLRTHSQQKPFSCSICNKEFTTKWNLKLHKWTHATRGQKPFKCEMCKAAFIRECDYVSHMNSHKSLRPYTCNYCGAQFIRKYNCQRHVKEHENEKTYNCDVCGKSFHRSYYLKDHMRVHSGDRPYSCHICGKTSTTKSNHNKHVQIHHAREPVSTEN